MTEARPRVEGGGAFGGEAGTDGREQVEEVGVAAGGGDVVRRPAVAGS